MQKFFKTVAKIFLFTILCFNFAYAENITGSGNEVAEDTDEQQNINADDTEVTVKSSFTLERANSSIKTNTNKNATIVVESGATVSATNSNAIEAADFLKNKGVSVEVINIHTIKPLDQEIILNSIEKTGCVVSAEEHNTIGGLGESVASLIVKNKLVPMEFVGVNDKFGESGKPSDLMKKYGLSTDSIVSKCEKVLKRK